MSWLQRTTEYLLGMALVLAQLALDGRAVPLELPPRLPSA
jgi:hypothetical protein